MKNPIKFIHWKSWISSVLIVCFVSAGLNIPLAQAQDYNLPAPGVMVPLSPSFDPPTLKGIKVHPDDPLRFDFILDKGNSALSRDQLRDESAKLIKYFLASLTIPEKDLWVNLSPYEKDRIIPHNFGLTEMGRDLLAEDYMLKQITASLIYPEGGIGRKFWKRVYAEARKKYKTSNIPINTFNKVWIVPEKAVVFENAKAATAYVVESRLKVMLEQDYLSLKKHFVQNDVNALGSNIVREIVIPELSREVNEGSNFARLRQVYNSLILAAWYKKKIRDSILGAVYADKNKIAGININDPQEKQKIYQKYLNAFKKGVYNYIKEEADPITQAIMPRKYFSGGLDLALTSVQGEDSPVLDINSDAATLIKKGPPLEQDEVIVEAGLKASDAASTAAAEPRVFLIPGATLSEKEQHLREFFDTTPLGRFLTSIKIVPSESDDRTLFVDMDTISGGVLTFKLVAGDLKADNLTIRKFLVGFGTENKMGGVMQAAYSKTRRLNVDLLLALMVLSKQYGVKVFSTPLGIPNSDKFFVDVLTKTLAQYYQGSKGQEPFAFERRGNIYVGRKSRALSIKKVTIFLDQWDFSHDLWGHPDAVIPRSDLIVQSQNEISLYTFVVDHFLQIYASAGDIERESLREKFYSIVGRMVASTLTDDQIFDVLVSVWKKSESVGDKVKLGHLKELFALLPGMSKAQLEKDLKAGMKISNERYQEWAESLIATWLPMESQMNVNHAMTSAAILRRAFTILYPRIFLARGENLDDQEKSLRAFFDSTPVGKFITSLHINLQKSDSNTLFFEMDTISGEKLKISLYSPYPQAQDLVIRGFKVGFGEGNKQGQKMQAAYSSTRKLSDDILLAVMLFSKQKGVKILSTGLGIPGSDKFFGHVLGKTLAHFQHVAAGEKAFDIVPIDMYVQDEDGQPIQVKMLTIYLDQWDLSGRLWDDQAATAAAADRTKEGGINFNTSRLNLRIKNSGGLIKFHIDLSMLHKLQNAPGFVPVIITIKPLISLPVFLGIATAKSASFTKS